MGQILHYRFARPVITLLIGEDAFRAFDAERLADHITSFTLAALGWEKPITECRPPVADLPEVNLSPVIRHPQSENGGPS
jgi:hypothetical protein